MKRVKYALSNSLFFKKWLLTTLVKKHLELGINTFQQNYIQRPTKYMYLYFFILIK